MVVNDDVYRLDARVALEVFASKPQAGTRSYSGCANPQIRQAAAKPVGASLLAMVVNDDVYRLDARVALEVFASKPQAGTRSYSGCGGPQIRQAAAKPVGASLLAMVVNDDAHCLDVRVALEVFASKPQAGTRSYRGSA